MGGLAGLLRFDGQKPDPALLGRMSARLERRGPHGEQRFEGGPVALAFRNQMVVRDRGTQPYVTDDLVVLLDGWIYDHEAVAERAGATSSSDLETLAHAWRRWGVDFVQHIDGDFAIAIWIPSEETLYLFRDRVGVRPLFWTRKGGCFAFASEIPAMLELPEVSRELCRERLAEYLSFQVVHAPRTLFRAVHQLEPGHWLKVNTQTLQTRCYWQLQYAAPTADKPNEGELIERLQQAVQRSVRRRVPRGGEAGLFLSGGLGSTAIAAAAKQLYLPLPSYTVSFADDPYPEAPIAGRVASLLGMEHHDVVLGTADLANAFDATVAAMGQPTGNPAAVLQLLLARAAATRVGLVLSGDGGEELFGGRMLDSLARRVKVAQRVARLPRPARSAVRRLVGRSRRARAYTAETERYALELGLGGNRLFSTAEREQLFRRPSLVRPHVRQEVLAPFYEGLDTDPINTILHGFFRSNLSEGSLVRADRTAAASGVEVRFPLLDREVVEQAAALPGALKIRRAGGALHTRWPLKAMLTGILPPPLVNRPKRGMPTPLDSWLAGPGRLFLEDRISRLKEDPLQLYEPRALERLHSEVGKRPGTGLRLWALFLLDSWIRTVDAN